MRRGCVITLVVTGVLLFLLLAVVIGVPLFIFDVVTTGPHVPTTTFAGPDTVAILMILPAKSGLAGMLAEGLEQPSNAFVYYMPWEGGAVLDLDPAGGTRTLTLTASLRHLGPLAMLFLGNPDVFSTATLEVAGIETWHSQAVVNERGAMVLRGDGAVSPDMKAWAGEHWDEAGQAPTPALEGGHFLELVLDNQGGRGFLALEGLLAIAPETLPPPSVPEAELPDSAGGETDLPAEMPEGGLESERRVSYLDWPEVLANVRSLRAVADFEEPDLYLVHLEANCPSAEAAERLVYGFESVRNGMTEYWGQKGVAINSSVTEAENQVIGEFAVTGIRPLIVDAIKEGSR